MNNHAYNNQENENFITKVKLAKKIYQPIKQTVVLKYVKRASTPGFYNCLLAK